MDTTLIVGLLTFCGVSAFTPGPNNLLALASGAQFGYMKTIPHILGVAIGFTIMLTLMGLGLDRLLTVFPLGYEILKYSSFVYLFFLSWKIANSGDFETREQPKRPMTLLGSAVFQWLNPKAWIAAAVVITSFTVPASFWPSLITAGAVNVVLALSAVSLWTIFGTLVKKWLNTPFKVKFFNITMAILLVISVLPSMFKG